MLNAQILDYHLKTDPNSIFRFDFYFLNHCTPPIHKTYWISFSFINYRYTREGRPTFVKNLRPNHSKYALLKLSISFDSYDSKVS